MKAKLDSRLKELKQEYEKGQEQLAGLNLQTADLSKTLLRISGAIQVLTELLEHKESVNSVPSNNGFETAENPIKLS